MGRSNFSHHTSGKQRDGEMDLIFHLRLSMMYIGHVQLTRQILLRVLLNSTFSFIQRCLRQPSRRKTKNVLFFVFVFLKHFVRILRKSAKEKRLYIRLTGYWIIFCSKEGDNLAPQTGDLF